MLTAVVTAGFGSPTFFIPIFLSFFIYHGTEASMRISECKMQLTVELTSHSGQVEERLTGKEEGLTGKEEG